MKLTMDDAKEYLRQIPRADGIKVMFLSYLERHKDDVGYITNKLPVGDLAEFRARPASSSTTEKSIATTSMATAKAMAMSCCSTSRSW